MKELQVNWKKLTQYLANQEKLYTEAPDSYKDQIDNLMISYIDGSDYCSMIEKLTQDPDKIDFIIIELSEYYHEFCNPDTDHDPAEHYINNIIRILNN